MVPFGSMIHVCRSAFSVSCLQVVEGVGEEIFTTFVTGFQMDPVGIAPTVIEMPLPSHL